MKNIDRRNFGIVNIRSLITRICIFKLEGMESSTCFFAVYFDEQKHIGRRHIIYIHAPLEDRIILLHKSKQSLEIKRKRYEIIGVLVVRLL